MILRRLLKGDKIIWAVLITLSLISLVEVYSASSNMTYKTGHYWSPFFEHGLFVVSGFLFAWFASRMPLGLIRILLMGGYGLSILMLLWVLLAGESINGAARLIRLGSFTFQPSELAKVTLVGMVTLVMANGYDKKIKRMSDASFYFAIGVIALPTLLIVMENLSTALIIMAVMVMLFILATPPPKVFYSLLIGAAVIGVGTYSFMKNCSVATAESLSSHGWSHRLSTWIYRVQKDTAPPEDPNLYDIYQNVQVTHSQIAVATCGVTGVGLGQSIERDFLPLANSDFIYAIIIDEGGLLMGIFVLALYLILLYLSIVLAQRTERRVLSLLVMGLALMIVTQAMVNMAVATGVIPVTGQTLPLMSKGGSSVWMCNIAIGIILRVSHSTKKKNHEETVENNN